MSGKVPGAAARVFGSVALLPAAGLVAVAAIELLGWRLRGDAGDALPVLTLAALWGVASSVAALGLLRVLPPVPVLALLLALGAYPYAVHALSAIGQGGGSVGLPAALAAAIGAVAARLGTRPVVRRLTAVAAVAASAAVIGPLLLSAPPADLAARGAHPDVIVLVLDTTRRDHLSLYGYARRTTPALDRLAERARVYDDAWSVAPWTPPSHASLFTGLMPAEHGVDGEHVPPFPPDVASLPTSLRAAGYRTAGFPANPNLLGRGWSRGFDVYRPPWTEGPHSLTPLVNRIELRGRPAWLDDDTTRRVLASARRFWAAHDDAPRFLFLNLVDPHDPYQPPAEDLARFLPDMSREAALAVMQDPQHYALERGVPPDVREVVTALYDAEIASMDRQVGEFFDWLEARGELDETLIVVTADHGERLGERGMLGHLLRMDQHLLRVPLFVRYPASVAAGRVGTRVRLTGVPGEVLALAGVPAPAAMEAGRLSAQQGELVVAQHRYFGWYVGQLRAREPDFDDAPYRGNWVLVADREHALLWSPERAASEAVLVDLDGDPDWTRNRLAAEPDTAAALLAVAQRAPAFEGEGPAADPSGESLDASLRERLEALGYLEEREREERED